MNRPRIVVADDQTLVAEGLRSILQSDYDVVGIVGNGLDLIQSVRALKPDVVIIDVSMRLLNGIDAGKQLRNLVPRPKLVFLAMNMQLAPAAAAIQQGPCAYLLKNCESAELLKAIDSVLHGKPYITARVSDELIANWEAKDPNTELTDRQRQVLQLLAEGKSMKEAGKLLELSERTIAFHKYKLMRCYQLHNSAEVMQFAIKQQVFQLSI